MKRKVKGANKIGINEIAEAVGISKSTVSRALNDHPKISIETKQKVLKCAQKLGYKPNIPDLISNKKTKSIAVIIPHTQTLFLRNMLKAIRETSNRKGYSLFVCESNYDIDVERKCLEQIKTLGFLSVIYLAHQKSKDLLELEYLAKEQFPLIIINDIQLNSDVSTVILDIHQSLNDGIKHLKSNGANDVALVIDDKNDNINSEIGSLFLSMTEDMDIKSSDDDVFIIDNNEDGVKSVVNRIITGSKIPDAIIFSDYIDAYKAWHIINESSAVNKKVLIMSINSNEFLINAKPNITYIHLQGSKIGAKAASLAFIQIKNKSTISTKVYFSRLIIKSSSIPRN